MPRWAKNARARASVRGVSSPVLMLQPEHSSKCGHDSVKAAAAAAAASSSSSLEAAVDAVAEAEVPTASPLHPLLLLLLLPLLPLLLLLLAPQRTAATAGRRPAAPTRRSTRVAGAEAAPRLQHTADDIACSGGSCC